MTSSAFSENIRWQQRSLCGFAEELAGLLLLLLLMHSSAAVASGIGIQIHVAQVELSWYRRCGCYIFFHMLR